MARIRTIKPEFWTDEVVVKLPFEARLLFIGLWNFCDDYGCIKDEPGRIQLQVFPGDASIDVCALIDLLVASELVERLSGPSDARFLVMRSWEKHQKVDNPSKIRALDSPRESYRKIAIPSSSRRSVAMKYGCKPGQRADAQCYFCGAPGEIWWPTTTNGKPGSWVAFSELEIDHFEPEKSGGRNLQMGRLKLFNAVQPEKLVRPLPGHFGRDSGKHAHQRKASPTGTYRLFRHSAHRNRLHTSSLIRRLYGAGSIRLLWRSLSLEPVR